MVSYYNPMAMYRQQSGVGSAAGPQFHHAASPAGPAWYSGYHHQTQVPTPHQQYCMQDGDQPATWHHPMLHQEFTEFAPIAPGQSHGQQILGGANADSALPSPPMTVSGSELSSPAGGSASPPQLQRTSVAPPPPPMPGGRKSPYEWMRKPSYQSQPNPGKTRTKDKYRVVYTDHQRLELEKEFHYSRYITIRRKAELAASLGLSERQVKIWFQNRRAKERKQVKKREELTQKEFKVEPGTSAHDAMIASAQVHSGFHHQNALHQNMAAVAANLHQHAHQLHQHQVPMHHLCTPD